jgi:hypothetical protein
VIGRAGFIDMEIEWKYDRRQPKLTLKGGNYASAEENLQKGFKEEEYIIFSQIWGNKGSLKK